MKMQEKISLTVGGIGGVVLSYITSLDTLVKILFLFMVIDFTFGILNGFFEKEINSAKMFKGGVKKGSTFLIIIVAYHLGNLIDFPMAKDITVTYYITMETLSIFENAIKLDLPLPSFLKDGAERLKEVTDKGDNYDS